jgi:hypothetical protein
MFDEAYNLGIQLAIADSGITKKAALSSVVGGAKRLGTDALYAAKDYLTAEKLRGALKRYSTASVTRRAFNPKPASAAYDLLNQGGNKPAIDEVKKLLEQSISPPSEKQMIRKELNTEALKYLIPAGVLGAGAGGYAGLKHLYPKALGN